MSADINLKYMANSSDTNMEYRAVSADSNLEYTESTDTNLKHTGRVSLH